MREGIPLCMARVCNCKNTCTLHLFLIWMRHLHYCDDASCNIVVIRKKYIYLLIGGFTQLASAVSHRFAACNATLYGQSGYVIPPSMIRRQPDNTGCYWRLVPPPGGGVTVASSQTSDNYKVEGARAHTFSPVWHTHSHPGDRARSRYFTHKSIADGNVAWRGAARRGAARRGAARRGAARRGAA